MPPVVSRRVLRRDALQTLASIFAEKGTVRSVHYSCESFYKEDERTSRRVTAIGVCNFTSGDCEGFSIANTAETLEIPDTEIEGRFEEIERDMLKAFYSLVESTETSFWVHWNMRDTYYGFRALEHRANALGITPASIDDSKKVNLAKLIRDLEGPDYIGHSHLESLLRANGDLPRGFMSGEEEAAAFESGAYVKLHASTLGKVRAIWEIAELAASGKLRTEAKWWVRHGYRPSDIGWAIGEHWLYPILAIAFGAAGFAWGIAQFF